MIVHIVAWKYREETSQETRREHIAKLKALPGVIPDILSFEIGGDILKLERSYDTGLVARFSDLGALEAYTNHPEHQKVASLGKLIAENVISVDFPVD